MDTERTVSTEALRLKRAEAQPGEQGTAGEASRARGQIGRSKRPASIRNFTLPLRMLVLRASPGTPSPEALERLAPRPPSQQALRGW